MLVSVERIESITEGGFENLEIAQVAGVATVVGKGEFKVGDLCVFFRAGSIIPADTVRSPYLERSTVILNRKLGFKAYRIKNRKFGTVTSAGIAFTLTQFYRMMRKSGIDEIYSSKENIINRKKYRALEHDDLTNVVGAMQYTPKGRYLRVHWFKQPVINIVY